MADRAAILVAGAAGNVGGAVVRVLLERGAQVRALVRDRAASSIPQGVQVAAGDLNQPGTLLPHLDSVGAVFMLSGYAGLEQVLAGMRQAGVRRVVLLSAGAAVTGDRSNAVARYHIDSERLVRESGLAWTLLRPNSFMSNTFRWAGQLRSGDVVRLPFADVPVAAIDPDDIGAVAAAALTGDGHAGRVYRLSGPESLRPADQVAAVARVLGREVRFEAQPDEEARREMSGTMPPEYVDAFFRFFAGGELDESRVEPTVSQVIGRPPRSFAQWAAAHTEALRRAATAPAAAGTVG